MGQFGCHKQCIEYTQGGSSFKGDNGCFKCSKATADTPSYCLACIKGYVYNGFTRLCTPSTSERICPSQLKNPGNATDMSRNYYFFDYHPLQEDAQRASRATTAWDVS